MILHCNTLTHPLKHRGTMQRERLLTSIMPGHLKLDDRSIEELIAFAGTLSRHIRYWDEENKEAGDWLNFWESEDTTLLAIIAATDLDGPRTSYRSKELEYYRLKDREDKGLNKPGDPTSLSVLNEMVLNAEYGVYALASTLLSICQKTPATHTLKKEIINIIGSKLKEPLYRLIQFHKAIDPEAIKKYSGFIGTSDCASPWGLPDNPSFECINFVLPGEFAEELWKLFLAFYKALSIIINKARKAFESSLRSRHDHQPHITLFITFLYLFRHLQDDLNLLPEKHLLFYYHDVLRLEKRRLVPDKVHIVFEIAANVVRHRIEKGTLLKAGADDAGIPMFYALSEERVISNVKLAEKKNLYIKEYEHTDAKMKVSFAIALPAADMRDGVDEEWPDGSKAWSALSGLKVYERLAYRYMQLQKISELAKLKDKQVPTFVKNTLDQFKKSLQKLKAFSGFSISSTELWLNKGFFRIISLDFSFNGTEDNSLLGPYTIEISTEKGMVPLKIHPIELDDNTLDNQTKLPESLQVLVNEMNRSMSLRSVAFVPAPDDPTFQSYCRIVRFKNTQHYAILLNERFPSVLPASDSVPPFLRFRSNELFDFGLKEINSVTLFTYADSKFPFQTQQLPVRMQRSKGVQIESGTEFVVDQAGQQSIVLSYPEMFYKQPEFLNIELSGNFTLNSKAVFNTNQWVNIPSGNLPNVPGFTEKKGILTPPENFNFSNTASNEDGWLQLTFSPSGTIPPALVLNTNLINISYRSKAITIPIPASRLAERHFISAYTSFGDWIQAQNNNEGFLPNPVIKQPLLKPILSNDLLSRDTVDESPTANGNLFLGLENIVPNQSLSILFKTADGTGNPDHYAPEIEWSYLRNNEWIKFPPQFILSDSTLGIKQTGIILFQIPDDINNGNTWIQGKEGRTDLYWIRASAVEIPEDLVFEDALPMLKDIHVHAAEAIFKDNRNTETHLSKGISPASITALQYRDVNVKKITQPYASFDGRESELFDETSYLRRVHERLRHKQRAVTTWDYERIVLEAYPKVAITKCLSHTRRVYTARPGQVTMAAIPYPEKMTGNRIYFPTLEAGDLKSIHDHLTRYTSYFVSGYGDPEFCCCDDGCECDHHIDRLQVINARFEPVRLKVCVRFYEGRDIPYYTKQLNEALKVFLAPWTKDSRLLHFGVEISLTQLLKFLENLDYVDVILNLQVKHFSSRQKSDLFEEGIAWSTPETITPFTSASVLTTYLDRLNEDNPNVIDHEINVLDKHDRCSCDGCLEKDENIIQPTPVQDPPEMESLRDILIQLWENASDTNKVIIAFLRSLNELQEQGILKGEKINDPLKGEEGVNAYRIEKIKISGNKISQLKVYLSFDLAKPFKSFSVNNPNLH